MDDNYIIIYITTALNSALLKGHKRKLFKKKIIKKNYEILLSHIDR